jgi:hypothetical protein
MSTGVVGRSLAVLSGSEENSALSGALAHLSTVHEKCEQIQNEQAAAEFYYLSELIKDHIGLVGAVKEVFHVSGPKQKYLLVSKLLKIDNSDDRVPKTELFPLKI